ncbi:hypothetical protein RFI_08966, partial [Reticulomyxa filosa]
KKKKKTLYIYIYVYINAQNMLFTTIGSVGDIKTEINEMLTTAKDSSKEEQQRKKSIAPSADDPIDRQKTIFETKSLSASLSSLTSIQSKQNKKYIVSREMADNPEVKGQKEYQRRKHELQLQRQQSNRPGSARSVSSTESGVWNKTKETPAEMLYDFTCRYRKPLKKFHSNVFKTRFIVIDKQQLKMLIYRDKKERMEHAESRFVYDLTSDMILEFSEETEEPYCLQLDMSKTKHVLSFETFEQRQQCYSQLFQCRDLRSQRQQLDKLSSQIHDDHRINTSIDKTDNMTSLDTFNDTASELTKSKRATIVATTVAAGVNSANASANKNKQELLSMVSNFKKWSHQSNGGKKFADFLKHSESVELEHMQEIVGVISHLFQTEHCQQHQQKTSSLLIIDSDHSGSDAEGTKHEKAIDSDNDMSITSTATIVAAADPSQRRRATVSITHDSRKLIEDFVSAQGLTNLASLSLSNVSKNNHRFLIAILEFLGLISEVTSQSADDKQNLGLRFIIQHSHCVQSIVDMFECEHVEVRKRVIRLLTSIMCFNDDGLSKVTRCLQKYAEEHGCGHDHGHGHGHKSKKELNVWNEILKSLYVTTDIEYRVD